uniref:Uncharacterized protein n=1 Tax=Sinocyclocheilus grahami TaxID=75366 RepID=A0A672T4S0_SINGR
MLAMPPPGPEFIELMLIWLPIWPMLLELVAMDTLRFMPLPLYMLLLALNILLNPEELWQCLQDASRDLPVKLLYS